MEIEIPKVPLTRYPLIDSDPHFSRVVRFFRPSDYLWWAGVTIGTPVLGGILGCGPYVERSVGLPDTLRGIARSIRAKEYKFGPWPATLIGAVGGFLIAYSFSSARFVGLIENSREVKKDFKEMRQRAKLGLPLYGTSSLNPNLQKIAASYSTMAFFNFGIVPMFNFVNHPYHGVDTSKYYKPEESDE